MRLQKYCSASLKPEIFPYSKITIFRQNGNKEVTNKSTESFQIQQNNEHHQQKTSLSKNDFDSEYRENEMKIQMLSKNLYKQIFGNRKPLSSVDPKLIEKCHSNMKKYGIKIGESPKLEDVILKLPNLKGKTIEEHFHNIAKEQCRPYEELINSLLYEIPKMPIQWSTNPGWTCYCDENNYKSVEYPEEDGIVFDVEVCVNAGYSPVLACAVSGKYWYSWVSPGLFSANSTKNNVSELKKYMIDDMISLGNSGKPKLIVGHNVSYDRVRIREEYLLDDSKARFLDTMSLHVCVSGITSYQRAMLKSNKEFDEEDLEWSSQSSLNSLAEVYKLYCGKELKKEPRDIFIKGTLEDIKENFQYLMSYCAGDVVATQNVLNKIFPLFKERFPHPATLAGMLEIGK